MTPRESDSPRLYDDLAEWWPLLSSPDEYETEAARYAALLDPERRAPEWRVLELGSGGGNTASHWAGRFDLTLCDLAPAMLRVSRALNPQATHVEGDIRTVRLGQTFDGVFLHDAVAYMTTEDDLFAALSTAAAHLEGGGRLLLVPDDTAETYEPGESTGGHDASDGRGLRFLEWRSPLTPGRTWFDVHFAFLLRDVNGAVRAVHDHHRHGLFPRATWFRILDRAGFDAEELPFDIEGVAAEKRLFVATRR